MEQVFLSELITSGAWADRPLAGSLASEGQAMLLALAEDLSRLDGVRVVTTWDNRLGPFPLEDVEAEVVETVAESREAFADRCRLSDRTLVIAPELEGQLAQQFQRVIDCGGHWVGSSPGALQLASDKLVTFEHLRSRGIPTVSTWTSRESSPPTDSDRVVWKRRDGAGSVGLEILDAGADPTDQTWIGQPLVRGLPVSVAVLASPAHDLQTSLPVAVQHISPDDRLRYLGGEIPSRIEATGIEAISELAVCAVAAVEGLAGWIGVDLVVPDRAPGAPLVIEINPRLTTSYLGYRQLSRVNLSRWVAWPEQRPGPLEWHDGRVIFTAEGDWQRE